MSSRFFMPAPCAGRRNGCQVVFFARAGGSFNRAKTGAGSESFT